MQCWLAVWRAAFGELPLAGRSLSTLKNVLISFPLGHSRNCNHGLSTQQKHAVYLINQTQPGADQSEII